MLHDWADDDATKTTTRLVRLVVGAFRWSVLRRCENDWPFYHRSPVSCVFVFVVGLVANASDASIFRRNAEASTFQATVEGMLLLTAESQNTSTYRKDFVDS